MKFMITLELDEDGIWIPECPSIPSCVSQRLTRAEAVTNIRESISACQEVRIELGMENSGGYWNPGRSIN